MKSVFLSVIVLAMSSQFMSCSASGNSDGTCKRTCGNRPIGGGRLKVYAVSAAEKWECSTDNIPERTFRFKVVEETSSASKEKFDPTKDIPKTIPVAGIDFAPEGVPEGTFNTDSSELCTDSCGYATMKFTPTCMTQDLAVSITVPGADLDGTTTAPTIQFTVTKK